MFTGCSTALIGFIKVRPEFITPYRINSPAYPESIKATQAIWCFPEYISFTGHIQKAIAQSNTPCNLHFTMLYLWILMACTIAQPFSIITHANWIYIIQTWTISAKQYAVHAKKTSTYSRKLGRTVLKRVLFLSISFYSSTYWICFPSSWVVPMN